MIHIEHACFTYENAVNDAGIADIQVKIPRGQVILLCGESGSGKTTFGRFINGLIPHYYDGAMAGEVVVADKNVGECDLYELAPLVGSVFQNPKSQFYTLMTDEEIVFACENLGLDRNVILERFDKTVEQLKLESLLGKSLFALSGGEKQKIACASVSALMPEVFVLDEPSSNLDIKTIEELRQILLIWKAEGKTIIIAEHRLLWLRDVADRVLYFKEGRVCEDLSAGLFWEKTTDTLNSMGLRSYKQFAPVYHERQNNGGKLIFRNFNFNYGEQCVLNIPSLTIPQGAVVAVLGNNGAGKTTFARCFCGLNKKCSGTLCCNEKSHDNKQRMTLCYMVMQDVNHQLFTESVEDEVMLGTSNLQSHNHSEEADRILKELDIYRYKEFHPMSLSGGQKQRVAIASALTSHKEILVFDEPTSGLDFRHMKEVAASIRQLSDLGKTQFLITHDPELVAACCDYFIFMEHGEIVLSGGWSPDNIEFIAEYFKLL